MWLVGWLESDGMGWVGGWLDGRMDGLDDWMDGQQIDGLQQIQIECMFLLRCYRIPLGVCRLVVEIHGHKYARGTDGRGIMCLAVAADLEPSRKTCLCISVTPSSGWQGGTGLND